MTSGSGKSQKWPGYFFKLVMNQSLVVKNAYSNKTNTKTSQNCQLQAKIGQELPLWWKLAKNDHKMVKSDFTLVICMERKAFKHAQNRSFDWFEKYSSYFELEVRFLWVRNSPSKSKWRPGPNDIIHVTFHMTHHMTLTAKTWVKIL